MQPTALLTQPAVPASNKPWHVSFSQKCKNLCFALLHFHAHLKMYVFTDFYDFCTFCPVKVAILHNLSIYHLRVYVCVHPGLYEYMCMYVTPGWRMHKLESRLPGETSITSDMQVTSPLWQKVKKN